MGKTGRAILAALIAGHDDPIYLSSLAQGLLKKKTAALQDAVVGRITPDYTFLLAQQLRIIDDLTARIAEFDAQITHAMQPFATALAIVCSTPGVAERAGQVILAEIGTDMTRFPTAGRSGVLGARLPGPTRVPASDDQPRRQSQ